MQIPDDYEYGYLFHVMLRKYCETKMSGVLWNMVHVLGETDADAAKKDRVWNAFCAWCDKRWRETPDAPFYQVALDWCQTRPSDENGCPTTSAGNMFRCALEAADRETQTDLNETALYLLKEAA